MAENRILLVDDHPLARESLAIAIRARHPTFTINCFGTIAAAETATQPATGYKLALLDYKLPDTEGFSGLFRLLAIIPEVPIAIVSAYDKPEVVEAARALGAAGFLSKAEPLDVLVDAVDRLLAGKAVFPQSAARREDLAKLRSRLQTLSAAQTRVLEALAKGHLNKQIADDLGIAEGTVKAHMTAIFRKLGISNRVQAVLRARSLFTDEGIE